jgi:hypothetical protein
MVDLAPRCAGVGRNRLLAGDVASAVRSPAKRGDACHNHSPQLVEKQSIQSGIGLTSV